MINWPSQLYTAFSPDPAPAATFFQWLAQSYGLSQYLNVLDVGCGTGQALPLYASLGWRVVGLEVDPDFYAAAGTLAKTFCYGEVQARLGGFNDIEDVDAL